MPRRDTQGRDRESRARPRNDDARCVRISFRRFRESIEYFYHARAEYYLNNAKVAARQFLFHNTIRDLREWLDVITLSHTHLIMFLTLR